MSLTPNSKVPRTVKVQCDGMGIAELLDKVCLDSPPVPVRILFEPEGVSVWTLNVPKTMQCLISRWPIAGLKVKEPCVVIADPKELSNVIRAKSRGLSVRIETAASQPIKITTPSNGGAEIMPSDEDDCLLIPDRWVIPKKDGKFVFPMFDNEPATSEATISKEQLTLAYREMQSANAPYVVITFDKECEARSGHWTSKSTKSWVPIQADWTGEPFTVSFTECLKSVIGAFSKDTTTLRVAKHTKGQFVVIESVDGAKTTVVVTEALREI